MNFRLLSILGLVAILFTACNKDEINDLENRLNDLENALGSNEPLKMEFATTNLENVAITKNTSFLFKAKGYNEYIIDYQDGTYEVYIERFADVEWNEGAWIFFYYNAETKEVTNPSFRPYFYDKFGTWINPRFDASLYTGHTVNITVNSFDPVTGKVDIVATGSTTTAATNNEYTNKAMTCKLSFKGTLDIFID